jgi:hypothetical protein
MKLGNVVLFAGVLAFTPAVFAQAETETVAQVEAPTSKIEAAPALIQLAQADTDVDVQTDDQKRDAFEEKDNVDLNDVVQIIDAFKNGNWVIGFGFLLMVLIAGVRRLVTIPSNIVPYVGMGLCVLASVASHLVFPDKMPLWEAVLTAVFSGVMSSGFYEYGKKIPWIKSFLKPFHPDAEVDPEPKA